MCGLLSCNANDDDDEKSGEPAKTSPGDETCESDTSCPEQKIATIRLVGVTFTSDHAVLKDHDSNWDDGGARYPKPEWTPSDIYPISHTHDKSLSITLDLEIEPPDAKPETVTIRGDQDSGEQWFEKEVELRPGKMPIALTSRRRLPSGIGSTLLDLQWQFQGTSGTVENTVTSHPILYTLDTPSTPARRPGVTLARLRHAIEAAGGAGSLDPQEIVKHIMGQWGNFNLSVVYDNAWDLADDASRGFVGADCQTIVRYTQNVTKMVGVPGTSEFVVVWAKVPTPRTGEVNAAYTPNMSDPKQWYNDHRRANPARARWRATLVDGDGGQNRYEACLKYTHAGTTVYHAGGVGAKSSPDDVITVFSSMSWRDEDTGTLTKVIHNYRSRR